MKTQCKTCGMAYPVNPEFVGMKTQCPHCGAVKTLLSTDIIKDRPRNVVEAEPKGFDGLGFALGLLLNIPGVFIASIVNGRRGVMSALWGLLVNAIVGGVLIVIYALVS